MAVARRSVVLGLLVVGAGCGGSATIVKGGGHAGGAGAATPDAGAGASAGAAPGGAGGTALGGAAGDSGSAGTAGDSDGGSAGVGVGGTPGSGGASCATGEEVCNGVDDNCDGVVDNATAANVWCASAGGVGEVCRSGACVCLLSCAGTCVDPHNDPADCGGCGNVCPIACEAGQCAGATRVIVGSTTYARLPGGSVWYWGQYPFTTALEQVAVPAFVPDVSPAIDVAASGTHACAVLQGGAVWCWGDASMGELGRGVLELGMRPPAPVKGLANVVSVVTADDHTCALLSGGTVDCWGAEVRDDGAYVAVLLPTPVPGLSGVTAISASGDGRHVCALRGDGSVACWGQDDHGQLGDGATTYLGVTKPKTVAGVSNAVAVAAGYSNSCAVLADTTVTCWGGTDTDELLDGTPTNHLLPAAFPGLSGVTAVGLDGGHGCALLADGTVQCWGANAAGELGDGTTQDRVTPAPVVGLSHAVAISVGVRSSCAVLDDGSVQCWGGNYWGQLGDGTTKPHPLPAPVVWH